MPILDLSDARAIGYAGRPVQALAHRGAVRWREAAVETNPIADLYGIGSGKIEVHLRPQDAIMDGTNVVSVPNKGGLGAAGNALVSGTVTRKGHEIDVNGGYLYTENPINLRGRQVFMVLRSPATTGNIGLMGRNASGDAGGRTHVQWQAGNTRFLLDRWTGAANQQTGVLAVTVTPELSVLELLINDSLVIMRRNGVGGVSVANPYPDFLIDRFGMGRTLAGFPGHIGEIVILTTAGNQPGIYNRIRSYFYDKYGIALT